MNALFSRLGLLAVLLALFLPATTVAQQEHLVDGGVVVNPGYPEIDSVRVTGNGNFHHGMMAKQIIERISVELGVATNWEDGTVGTFELYEGDFYNRGMITKGGTVSGGTFRNNAGGSVMMTLEQNAGTVHNSGIIADVTLSNTGTFNNLSGSTLGSLEMLGGTVSNMSSINNLNYTGGNYSGTGTVGTLTVTGDSRHIDWGSVRNLYNQSTGIIGNITLAGGTSEGENRGTIGNASVNLDGRINNYSGGTIENATLNDGGRIHNRGGTVENVTIYGGWYDNGSGEFITGSVTNDVVLEGGRLFNRYTIDNATVVSGEFNNHAGSTTNNLTMTNGFVGNIGTINNLTYYGGTYEGHQTRGSLGQVTLTGTGTIGTLTVAGDSTGIDWGNLTTANVNSGGNLYNFENTIATANVYQGGQLWNYREHYDPNPNSFNIERANIDGGWMESHGRSRIERADVRNGGHLQNHAGIVTANVENGTMTNTSGARAGVVNVMSGGEVINHGQLTDHFPEIREANIDGGLLTNSGNARIGTADVRGDSGNAGILHNYNRIDVAQVHADGQLYNYSGGTVGSVSQTGGMFENVSGTVGSLTVSNTAVATNAGNVTGVTNQSGGTVTNDGWMNQSVLTGGTFNNNVAGTVQNTLVSNGTFQNNGTVANRAIVAGGAFNNQGSVNETMVSGGTFNNDAGGYVTNAEVYGSGMFNNRAGGYVEEITQWGGGDLRNRGGIGRLIYLESSANNAISPASMGLNVAMSSSDGRTVTNNEGEIRDPVTVLNSFTFNNLQGFDEDGSYMGRVGQLSMVGGSEVNNEGWISSLTYHGGSYNNTYNGEYFGTIGTLNIAGDARDVDNWGTVNNLAFSDNGTGFMSITGFADGTFGGINVTDTVNLANANLQLNLSGTFDDWFGTSLWDDIFGGASVTGWETALFNVSWEDGIYTNWLEYGQTWNSGTGYFVAFGADGLGVTAIPEPATLAIIGLGLAGLGLARRRRK